MKGFADCWILPKILSVLQILWTISVDSQIQLSVADSFKANIVTRFSYLKIKM